MESDFYLNESHATYVKYMNLYTKLMMDTIEHLGVYKDKARQEINQMLSFEKKLANVS